VNSNNNNVSPFDISNIITIPYLRNLSENISQFLRKCGLNVVFTVPKKLNCVIKRGKDNIDIFKKTDIVYKINCSDCDAVYIGQTKRHLLTRIKEHQANIRKRSHLVVSKHRSSLSHDFNWSNSEILHCERLTKKREIAEMFFIKNCLRMHAKIRGESRGSERRS